MVKPTTIVRYLDRAKIVDTGQGGYYGIHGIPLRDLTQADWDGLSDREQKTVEASPLYRKTKPDGWVSQEDLDQQAYEDWAQDHPQEAKAQAEAKKSQAQREQEAQAAAQGASTSSTGSLAPVHVQGSSGEAVEPTGAEAEAEDASEGAGAEEPAEAQSS
jgi:hypothetical protein